MESIALCSDCDYISYWLSENVMTESTENHVQNYFTSLCNDSRNDFESNYALCKMILFSFPVVWDYIAKQLEMHKLCDFICDV